MILDKTNLAGCAKVILVDQDPTTVPHDIAGGSLIIFCPAPGAAMGLYFKNTDGDNTDVTAIVPV
jgi:hypothetical protein